MLIQSDLEIKHWMQLQPKMIFVIGLNPDFSQLDFIEILKMCVFLSRDV